MRKPVPSVGRIRRSRRIQRMVHIAGCGVNALSDLQKHANSIYCMSYVGMIRRESVASGNEYPMRPASYIRTAPTVYPSSSPAGTWFAGNAQASFCGFRGQCLIVCSRQTPHVPGKRDNSWSTRAQPECRAPSYRPDYRCGSRRPRPDHIAYRSPAPALLPSF